MGCDIVLTWILINLLYQSDEAWFSAEVGVKLLHILDEGPTIVSAIFLRTMDIFQLCLICEDNLIFLMGSCAIYLQLCLHFKWHYYVFLTITKCLCFNLTRAQRCDRRETENGKQQTCGLFQHKPLCSEGIRVIKECSHVTFYPQLTTDCLHS